MLAQQSQMNLAFSWVCDRRHATSKPGV